MEACLFKNRLIKKRNTYFYIIQLSIYIMSDIDCSKEDLIKELQELKHEHEKELLAHRKAEDEVVYLSNLQRILMMIASKYINIPLDKVEESIQESLGELGRFVNADRVYIFDYKFDSMVCNNTYEWCEEGIDAQIEELQQVPIDVIPWWIEAHSNNKTLFIPNVFELPKDDGVRQILEPQEVKSLMTLPMMNEGKLIGFLGFDSVKAHHYYTEKEELLLKVFSDMLVNVTNRKLMEQELVAAKIKAEESDKLKTSFLANMSHEIRTPMNGIIGFAGLLKETSFNDEEHNEYVGIIEKSGQRMLNIINDIVEISKIESGQIELKMNEIDVNSKLSSLYTKFKDEAFNKDLELICNTDIRLKEYIITDEDKLVSIINNLLSNALKFTHSGTITFGYDKVNDYLQFYVKDTGEGITPMQRELIFERFRQGNESLARKYEGSGLGLCICKAFIQLLGGEIWLESEVGKGSNFYFTIPIQVEAV